MPVNTSQASQKTRRDTEDMAPLYRIEIGAIWQKLTNEPLVFWGICFYLFVEYVRIQSMYEPLQGLPLGSIALLGTAALYLIDTNRRWHPNVGNVLLFPFLIVVLLSSYFAYDTEIAYEQLADYYLWLIVFVLITQIVNTETRFFIFYLSFLLYSFKMSQHGFASWAANGFAFRDWGIAGAPGWFHNSGELGIQLCVFFPLSFYFVLALRENWGKLKKAFFYLFPMTAAGAIIATSSRGALVGLAAVLFWMVLQSKYKTKAIVAAVVLSVPVILMIPQESMDRMKRSGTDRTSQVRLERWENGIDMMLKNPVLGVGHANYAVVYPNYYGADGNTYLSHNIFIQVGSELGFTGLAFFLGMIFFSFNLNRKTREIAKRQNNNFMYLTAHGLDAALVGYLISGSFVTVFYYPYFWINFSLVIALNNIAKSYAEKPGHEKNPQRRIQTGQNQLLRTDK